ncbi:TraB/GumN family protein [Erythrobacter litoralis]|uniref:Polysaccharide biosynthesis protein GumN n=1 Tax=Erythrobacter litoralis (strain HTCC2594) TaxID=314225 RepID=Q2NAN0_ERYLH|nr:TraB/GumN family protein [Erythrobacter litoralis]ABC63261.1 hypothetical protein ELI_05845 [Erythrobacter litoralis HTCC2594]
MIRQFILAGLAALALTGCGEPAGDPPADPPVNPLLWELTSADGEVEGWLYGTIHALPDGIEWRGDAIDDAIRSADYLVVEVAALDDGAAISRQFTQFAHSAGHPPLSQRVEPQLRDELDELIDRTALSDEDYRTFESWGAALMLAQAIRNGMKSENGVDKALIRAFRGRGVVELEGAERQFRIFDSLAEEDQRAMLNAVIEQAQDEQTVPPEAARLWLSGDAEALAAEASKGILADPEVREALLTRRNLAWSRSLDRMLAGERRPLVAVGAAHLVGSSGLVELLEAQGFTATRLR